MRLALIAGALAQFAAFMAVGWVVAGAWLRWAGGHIARVMDTSLPEGIGHPEQALAAIAGFVGFAVVLMAVHLVTGGYVFGSPIVGPLCGGAVVAYGLWRRRWPRGVPWLKTAGFSLVLVALFLTPALIGGSSVRAGDSSWHMGWTQQLLAGETVPTGPAPEFGANAYPWGFHATMAAMVRLVPGSNALVAQEALMYVLLAGIPLAAACLARRLRSGAGWAGAVSGALIAGFGWITARAMTFDASPSEARFGADMVVASPNSVYELFPPAFPRELGLVVLAFAALAAVLAVRTEDRRFAVTTGVAIGLVGLISVPLMVTGVLWALVAAALSGRGARLRMGIAMMAPAAAVFALWAVPELVAYMSHGGFVDITPRLGVEWPLPVALAAWGLLLPLMVGGIALSIRYGTTSARVLVGFASATAVMLLLARARAALDWDLGGNATLLHQGRVWPVAHLLATAFAGVGLAALYELLRRRSKGLAVAATGAVVVTGALSLVLSSGGLTRIISNDDGGFVYGSDDFAPGSFVAEAAGYLGPDDVVLTEGARGANSLGFWLFAFSGSRIAVYDDPRLTHNDLRIRFSELARDYDERITGAGFAPDYIAVSTGGDDPPPGTVIRGEFLTNTWFLVPAGDGAQAP